MKLIRPNRLPAYYEVVFHGDTRIRFDEIYWSLVEAKEAVKLDVLASWDDDILYNPNGWRKTDENQWSFYAGDAVYDIRKVQPEAKS